MGAGAADGVAFNPVFVKERLGFCDKLLASMTSWMHKKLERGNPLEVGWLSADVSRRVRSRTRPPWKRSLSVTGFAQPWTQDIARRTTGRLDTVRPR